MQTVEDGINYQWRGTRGVSRKVVRAVLMAGGISLIEGSWEETTEEAVHNLASVLGDIAISLGAQIFTRRTTLSQSSGVDHEAERGDG